MFTCTKRYPEICVAHRNHRADTHCSMIHGYARTVEITIATDTLDERDWVLDLGNLRPIRDELFRQWDHRFLVSDDDPLLSDFKALEAKGALDLNVMDSSLGHSPGLEGSCKHLADLFAPMISAMSAGRCRLTKIEIWEKTDNRVALLLE